VQDGFEGGDIAAVAGTDEGADSVDGSGGGCMGGEQGQEEAQGRSLIVTIAII
jgi:hypothetical protein